MPLIVLTGVNGFIGNNLCAKILSSTPEELGFKKRTKVTFSNFDTDTNHDFVRVIGTDLAESLTRETAKRFTGSARYQYVDYEQLFDVLEALETPPDIIVHNGACSSTTETNQDIFDHLNTGYSERVWNYCTKYKVPLLYASSASVYGDGALGFSDRKEDCTQYTALNLYGKSKLDFDLWTLEQKQTPPTWFGLRYFNVFGPHEGHKEKQSSMAFQGYLQATQTGKIKLFKSNTAEYDDGDQERDFICVDDVIGVTKELIKVCMLRTRDVSNVNIPGNGLFLNVGTGIPNSWNALAQSVFKALQMPLNIEYVDIPQNLAKQYQNYTCADLSLFCSILPDYHFSVFEEAVVKYVQSYLLRGMK